MDNIGVFCGSSKGNKLLYSELAVKLADLMWVNNQTLVYGGGNVGLMGVLADRMIEKSGKVIGVIPGHIMELEIAHQFVSELIVVETMAERKIRMMDLSDAFIALPGGYGTLDEIMEVLTSNQLNLTSKPLGLLNVDGYFDHLLRFLEHGIAEGFIREEHYRQLFVSKDPRELLELMDSYQRVEMGKWIKDIKSV